MDITNERSHVHSCCYEHSCPSCFSEDVFSFLLGIDLGEKNCLIIQQLYVQTFEEQPDCLPK